MKRIGITLIVLFFLGNLISIPNAYAIDKQKTPPPPAEEVTTPVFYEKPADGAGTLPTPTGSYSGKGGAIKPDDALDKIVIDLIDTVSNIFIGFSVLFIIVAGIQYVLAQGEEEKIKKAHRSIIWAAAGVLVVMLSYTIVYIINTIF